MWVGKKSFSEVVKRHPSYDFKVLEKRPGEQSVDYYKRLHIAKKATSGHDKKNFIFINNKTNKTMKTKAPHTIIARYQCQEECMKKTIKHSKKSLEEFENEFVTLMDEDEDFMVDVLDMVCGDSHRISEFISKQHKEICIEQYTIDVDWLDKNRVSCVESLED